MLYCICIIALDTDVCVGNFCGHVFLAQHLKRRLLTQWLLCTSEAFECLKDGIHPTWCSESSFKDLGSWIITLQPNTILTCSWGLALTIYACCHFKGSFNILLAQLGPWRPCYVAIRGLKDQLKITIKQPTKLFVRSDKIVLKKKNRTNYITLFFCLLTKLTWLCLRIQIVKEITSATVFCC